MGRLNQATIFFNELEENLRYGKDNEASIRKTIVDFAGTFYPDELPDVQRAVEELEESQGQLKTTGPAMVDVHSVKMW